MRIFLASVLFGVGYVLLYAAVADGGKYAARPWQGLQA